MFLRRPKVASYPFLSNYRPQFYFRTTDVTGVITLPEGVEMACRATMSQLTLSHLPDRD